LSHDHHYVTIFPLDGAADAVSAMVGTEGFLMDMILKPEAVERALAAFMRIWVECFEEFAGIIAEGGNAGGVGWAAIWAPGTTFPIQEDCSYMISNEMFRRFCLPHIRTMVDVMDYGFYHLDGIGGLTHLDSLLEIESLKAIQWQPGAGKERLDQWYDVLRHILDQGKSVQVYARPDEIDGLVANVGTRGLLAVIGGATCDEAEMLMEKYGAGEGESTRPAVGARH
ncbi:MAG: hypothetical protein MUQ10_01185, partial [Anaerolineae bacterium]|nr:hypothetical protein [Anaerolineae bacterium]